MNRLQKTVRQFKYLQNSFNSVIQFRLQYFSNQNGDEANKGSEDTQTNLENKQQNDKLNELNLNEAQEDFENIKQQRQYQKKESIKFQLSEQQDFKTERVERTNQNETFSKFLQLAQSQQYNSKEFQELKPSLIQLIKSEKNCKYLHKYNRNLIHYQFQDKELANALAAQFQQVKRTFEHLDLRSMISVCTFFVNKQNLLLEQYQNLSVYIVETTLRNINKQEETSFNSIQFVFHSLSKIYIEDYSLFDENMARFEKNFQSFSDFQFVSILEKIYDIQMKLSKSQKYQMVNSQVKKRLRFFLQNPNVTQRILQITESETDTSQYELSKMQGGENNQAQSVIAKLSVVLSKLFRQLIFQNQINIQSNEEDLDSFNYNDVQDLDIIQKEYSTKYAEAWKKIETFTLKNYKILEDKNFQQIILALTSTRYGSLELYTKLLDEFYYRITNRPIENIESSFFCIVLRCFYSSRIQPINLEKYEKDFAEFTKKKLPSFQMSNKMTTIASYSSIGDGEMVEYIISQITKDEIRMLNKKGQNILFWSLCNVGVFKEDFFYDFMVKLASPTDLYYSQYPIDLVQVTQIFQTIKINQKQFWKKHEQILEKKLEDFCELTYTYHTMKIQSQSNYRKKTIGSIDVSDLLNAMQVEFYFEPIIEKIFNVDFVIKGITEAKLEEYKSKKIALATQFRDLSLKEYISVKKFDQTQHKINKKYDILLEIDGCTHFLSKNIKRQSTNSKIDTLQKLGYKVIQLDTYELRQLSQSQDRVKTVEYLISKMEGQVIKKQKRRSTKSKDEEEIVEAVQSNQVENQ
ncbi:RAP domain protein (macronuclear) [Tetrahymena thermophila SB210]|uniref:RAP domain protein n=1 Tax=Tetrahymena thermophila (strain SB210) TaxID=312017 RepID=Q23W04_TETTS|nr:RAP domain protein [Tetrahymena thermophila SB210]EAS00701.2 RAP domain protein [Tetrahymena thermophila SB210]|eukprot:XP_001020946.2 RAP domain protein [Tetrahymena thermophila SB210]